MSEQEQQTMTAEDLPDMEGFLREMGGDMAPEEPEQPNPDVETIPINGMEYQVPKAVARALEQGRRFQGEKDQLQVALTRQEAELAAFKAQMDSIQGHLMNNAQVPAAPQGPSEFVRAWQEADKALALEGVFEAIGKMQEAMLSKRDTTLSTEQQKMLEAFKAQQEQLASVSQRTAAQELYGQAAQGVQLRMQKEEVELPEEVQNQIVGWFMEAQAGHKYSDEMKESDFTAAWYRGYAESLRNKPPEPALSFGGRPPVSAPIPASRGGVPGQGFAQKRLPRSDEYLSGL